MHLFVLIIQFRGWEMLLQGTVSAPMWNSLHSPSQLPYKASVVTLPLPFWLLLFFFPSPGGYFSCLALPLCQASPLCRCRQLLGWAQPPVVLHNPLSQVQSLHLLCRNQGWLRLREFLSPVQAQSDPDHTTTFSLYPSPCATQPANKQPGFNSSFILFFIIIIF